MLRKEDRWQESIGAAFRDFLGSQKIAKARPVTEPNQSIGDNASLMPMMLKITWNRASSEARGVFALPPPHGASTSNPSLSNAASGIRDLPWAESREVSQALLEVFNTGSEHTEVNQDGI